MKKKNIIILLIVLVILILISLFAYKKFFERKDFKGEGIVVDVNNSSSSVKFNNKYLKIQSNLFDKDKKIIVEGTKQDGEYTIKKVYMNFNSEEEKEKFVVDKLYNNPSIKSFSTSLELYGEYSIFVIIPLKLSGQEYVDMLSPEEVYNFITNHYAPPLTVTDEEEVVINNKDGINVVEVNYYGDENIQKIDFNKNDESISFKRLGNGYYCIKVEVNQDLLEFIVM